MLYRSASAGNFINKVYTLQDLLIYIKNSSALSHIKNNLQIYLNLIWRPLIYFWNLQSHMLNNSQNPLLSGFV